MRHVPTWALVQLVHGVLVVASLECVHVCRIRGRLCQNIVHKNAIRAFGGPSMNDCKDDAYVCAILDRPDRFFLMTPHPPYANLQKNWKGCSICLYGRLGLRWDALVRSQANTDAATVANRPASMRASMVQKNMLAPYDMAIYGS